MSGDAPSQKSINFLQPLPNTLPNTLCPSSPAPPSIWGPTSYGTSPSATPQPHRQEGFENLSQYTVPNNTPCRSRSPSIEIISAAEFEAATRRRTLHKHTARQNTPDTLVTIFTKATEGADTQPAVLAKVWEWLENPRDAGVRADLLGELDDFLEDEQMWWAEKSMKEFAARKRKEGGFERE